MYEPVMCVSPRCQPLNQCHKSTRWLDKQRRQRWETFSISTCFTITHVTLTCADGCGIPVCQWLGEEKAHAGAVWERVSRSRCACVSVGCEETDKCVRTGCGLIQALVSVKEKLTETEGPDVKEQMRDQIRQWFIEVRCALFLSLLLSLSLSLSLTHTHTTHTHTFLYRFICSVSSTFPSSYISSLKGCYRQVSRLSWWGRGRFCCHFQEKGRTKGTLSVQLCSGTLFVYTKVLSSTGIAFVAFAQERVYMGYALSQTTFLHVHTTQTCHCA